MGFISQFGELVGSIIAVILMLILAVISFYITVFIVQSGADIAGLSVGEEGFTVLAAAILVAAAIIAGATPLSAIAGSEE
jgi:hypothetical protein